MKCYFSFLFSFIVHFHFIIKEFLFQNALFSEVCFYFTMSLSMPIHFYFLYLPGWLTSKAGVVILVIEVKRQR